MLRKDAGFTLIEFLLILAILAMIVAITIPNFLEAQVRSKVSATKADMRAIAHAIEAYNTDNNAYPEVAQHPGYSLPRTLTTPIAYLPNLPQDPFGFSAGDDLLWQYGTTQNYWWATQAYYDSNGYTWKVYPAGHDSPPAQWVLQSKGPDHAWARIAPYEGKAEVEEPYLWQYDPSNGTVSEGNIVRSGP